MEKNIRRVLGRNQVLPHTHHPRDIQGLASTVLVPTALIPFDVIGIDQTIDVIGVNPVAYSLIGALATLATQLPPLGTPAQKYRVTLRLCASVEARQPSTAACIGSIQFFQNGVAIGQKKSFGNAAASSSFLFPFSLQHITEVAPGTYTWECRWRIESGANNNLFMAGDSGRFEVEVDTMVYA